MENKVKVVEALAKVLNGKNGTSIIGILAIAAIVIGDMIINNHYVVEATGVSIKPVNEFPANEKTDDTPDSEMEKEDGANTNTLDKNEM